MPRDNPAFISSALAYRISGAFRTRTPPVGVTGASTLCEGVVGALGCPKPGEFGSSGGLFDDEAAEFPVRMCGFVFDAFVALKVLCVALNALLEFVAPKLFVAFRLLVFEFVVFPEVPTFWLGCPPPAPPVDSA